MIYRLTIHACGRVQALTIRAERRAETFGDVTTFFGPGDVPVASVPNAIIIDRTEEVEP